MDAPVKLKVFLGVLAATVITSSVTTGVVMNTLMVKMEKRMSAKIDELKSEVNQLKTNQDALTSNNQGETNVTDGQKAIYDNTVEELSNQLEKLENNVTSFIASITYHDARLSQLESDISASGNDSLNLDARVSQLEADISSMDAIILTQQTKITELEHYRTLDRADIDYLTTNITDLESQRDSDRVMIEEQNTTITQMHKSMISQASAVNNNTYLLISLETGITLDRALLQNLSDRTALLEYNRQSDLTTLVDIIERVTELENKQTEINNTLQSLGILDVPQVGFTVTNSSDNTDPRIFQTARYNSDSDFNLATGKFTCTRSGLYLFSATVTRRPQTTTASCWINVAGRDKLRVFATYLDSGYPTGSGILIVHLNYGDEVYLRDCSDTFMHYESSFSGVLIQQDVL